MEKDLEILREIGEKSVRSSCDIYKESITYKIKKFKLRRTLGRIILGKPIPGQGVLMQVDLSHKSKEEVDSFWKAIDHLRKAGIYFDTGMGGNFDMELDWSLTGAVVKCKKCGYNSEENREQLDVKKRKEHFITSCTKCGKKLDSNEGYYHIKPHFWIKSEFYHNECYQENGESHFELGITQMTQLQLGLIQLYKILTRN